MSRHSYLSVISPEAYVDIIYKGKKNVEGTIDELRILPNEMLKDKIADEIIEDTDFEKMIENIKSIINDKIIELSNITKEDLIKNRIKRIEKWGMYE